MRVLLEDKNKTVDIPDGLAPEAIETELRKFYTPEELYGSTTFQEREGYRIRKGRSTVDDGKLWSQAMNGEITLEIANQKSKEITGEFTEENDEKYGAYNWPERFAGATTELAPYMLDSAIQGTLYGEAMGGTAVSAALLLGQAGPQALLPEEILTVPAAYLGGKAIGQTWGTWMNASKVEGGGIFKSMVKDGIDPDTARNFAVPAGYLVGAIELLQVERLLPGFGRKGITELLKTAAKKGGSTTAKTLAKFSGRLAKNLATTTSIEVGQEMTQELIGIVAEVGAAIHEDMANEEGYTGPSPEDIKNRLRETLVSSLLGFPLLGLPGSVHSTVSLHGRDKFVDRVMTKQAEKSRENVTELIEQASTFDNFNDFEASLSKTDETSPDEESQPVIDDAYANKLGYDNRTLLLQATWNESRDLQGEHIYEENFNREESSGGNTSKIVDGFKSVQDAILRLIQPVSTRLGDISSSLKNKLRRHTFDLKQQVLKDEKAVKPFLKKYEKMSDRDQSDLDLALKNNDQAKIQDVLKRNGMEAEYASVRQTLDAIYKRAKDAGLDLGHITEYFPRKVKDYKAMLKFFKKDESWPEMQKELTKKEAKLGRKLTEEEKIDILNSFLRGSSKGSRKPGSTKKREISVVTPDINEFYQDSPQSLVNYIYSINDYIETGKFFGKPFKKKDGTTRDEAVKDSIGSMVMDLLASGEIKGEDVDNVSDILFARFSPKGTSKRMSTVKNISYIEIMGSFTSAITQIADIFLSIYKNGFYKTGKALAKKLTGQKLITKENIGIEGIVEEFTDKSRSVKALQAVFKMIGFNWIDKLGKETLINASFDKLSEKAKKGDKKFIAQMDKVFGKETAQVISDLKSKTASDNVKFLLFSELADVQPISLDEMPEGYLRGGNWRILYMLKTFTIKQIDIFRNDVFNLMRTNPIQASKNLIRLSALLIAANATTDLLKKILLGQPLESDDEEEDNAMWLGLIDNMLRLFGLSKYNLTTFKKDGIAEGIADIVLPPLFSSTKHLAKDITSVTKEDSEFEAHQAETIQSVPLFGKLYYWWFGGGRKKIEEKE